MSIFRSSLTRALVTPLLAASVGLGLTACDEANSAGPDQGTTLEDLNDDEGTGGLDEQGPGEDEIAQAPAGDNVVDFYEGEPVTVSGAIVQVFNRRSS